MNFALEGEYLWRYKDRIDREFMDMFTILPNKLTDHKKEKEIEEKLL